MIPSLLVWWAAAVALVLAASALSLRSYTRFAAAARGKDSFSLPRGDSPSDLDALLDPALDGHPGQQGLSNLLDGRTAFAARALSARAAGRSLDIITFIWETDRTGWLTIAELLAAADRGVRVRVLLDDVHVQGLDPVFLGLSMHPLIEVRLFNPTRNRGHLVRRALEFALGLSRFNRRLHSKVWLVDGQLAILGGRNIGDVYFAATSRKDQAAVDADVVLVGSRVGEVAEVFDAYWNLGLSLPILTLWPRLHLSLDKFRRRVARHVEDAPSRNYLGQALSPHTPQALLVDRLRWTDKVEVLADPVEKAFGRREGPWLSTRIDGLMQQATERVRLITPYFVPGQAGMAVLADLRQRGVEVSLLTSSLATTDLAFVHGAYAYYRRPLLEMGVRLHEFARAAGRRRRRVFLHSKVFLFDDRRAMIGSHNFDLRSANLNIEIGLVFEQPELVAELVQDFQRQTAPDLSYAVVLQDGGLRWMVNRRGKPRALRSEPGAGLWRRMAAQVLRLTPHAFF